MTDGYGSISFWGHSPSLDLLQEGKENGELEDKFSAMNLKKNSDEPVVAKLRNEAPLIKRNVKKHVNESQNHWFWYLSMKKKFFKTESFNVTILSKSPEKTTLQATVAVSEESDDANDLDDRNIHVDNTIKIINILLVGAADLRHLLKTVTCTNRHLKKKLHFHIIESRLEVYARHMLLLAIAFEPYQRIGLQDKVELFLELYGNSLIRAQSFEYLQKMSQEFIRMVTDFDYAKKKLPFLDITRLKFKERDVLESIFKFWKNPDRKYFDISKCWDIRVRGYLKTRYDTKMNAFDWDYHMKLAERQADIINRNEYGKWRNTGVAFENRDGEYTVPNTTLASGMVLSQEGEKVHVRGYWGDILISPFVAIGIEADHPGLFKKNNGIYQKTALNIASYNVTSMFHTLVSGEKYILSEVEEKETSSMIEEIEEEEGEGEKEESFLTEFEGVNDKNVAQSEKDEYQSIPVESFTLTFLPLDAYLTMPKKSQYQHFFDIVYFSNKSVHHLLPELAPIFADKTTVFIETAKFMVDLKKEQTHDYMTKITERAEKSGCKPVKTYNGEKDAVAVFRYLRKETQE